MLTATVRGIEMNSSHILRSIARPKNAVSVFRRCAANQAGPAEQNQAGKKPESKKTRAQTSERRIEMAHNRFHEVMRRVPHPVVVITAFDSPKLFTEQGTGKVYAEVPSHWSEQDVSATTNMTDRTQRIDDPQQLAPIARAMTVSSFTSLSMKPKPIVLFNCATPSRTHRAIANGGLFNVHILSADKQGAQIADLFARPQHDPQQESASGQKVDIQELQQARLGPLAQLKDLGVRVNQPDHWHQKWANRFKQMGTASEDDRRRKWGLSPPQLDGPGILYRLTCRVVDPRFDTFSSNSDSTVRSGFALVMGIVAFVNPKANARLSKNTLSYVDGTYRGESEVVLQHEVADATKRQPKIHKILTED